jgi:hypothetical protein
MSVVRIIAMPGIVVIANLRAAVYASHEELSAQVQANGALEGKLSGLLGFFAVSTSILFTTPHGLGGHSWLLLVGFGLGEIACVAGSMCGPGPNAGPSPASFYRRYGQDTEAAYLIQLLAAFADTARRNRIELERRRKAVAFAIWTPILLATLFAALSLT